MNDLISIVSSVFNNDTPKNLPSVQFGRDWPVVYILDNHKDEAYVGETLDASVRASQHLQNDDRRRLTQISLISDIDFNKSVILDLEAFLIKHMSVDGTFRLQNGNMGLHFHNYFNRAYYESEFRQIWDRLIERKLAKRNLQDIENSDLFKYSPYNSLSSDQYVTVSEIIRNLADAIEEGRQLTCVVRGGPGTGKTVLAVHLMKLLEERRYGLQRPDPEEDESIVAISENLRRLPQTMDIGFVVPMQSLRVTLQRVFENTPGLRADMVISPEDLTKSPKQYKLLVVDESHRLKRYKAIRDHKGFKDANIRMGLDPTAGDELDWIRLRSEHQILFYDPYQSIKPADIPAEKFNELLGGSNTIQYELHTQFRCKGGDAYIQYVRSVLSDNPPESKTDFGGYDIQLFDDCGAMTDMIKAQDDKYDLCRTVAGFAWEWITKKSDLRDQYDIEIGDYKYRWNTQSTDWVNSDKSRDEIGCIHTIQGYDLNYCGVIFGWEIDYDPVSKCFTVDKKKYKDNHGRETGKDDKLLLNYVLNIYKTMMTRGIVGTYVYACNPNLRDYLRQYFPVAQRDL